MSDVTPLNFWMSSLRYLVPNYSLFIVLDLIVVFVLCNVYHKTFLCAYVGY